MTRIVTAYFIVFIMIVAVANAFIKHGNRYCRKTFIPLSMMSSTSPTASIGGGTQERLSEKVKDALVKAFNIDRSIADAMVLPTKPEFGDYQCNAALPLAKKLSLKPRDVAEILMNTLGNHTTNR